MVHQIRMSQSIQRVRVVESRKQPSDFPIYQQDLDYKCNYKVDESGVV